MDDGETVADEGVESCRCIMDVPQHRGTVSPEKLLSLRTCSQRVLNQCCRANGGDCSHEFQARDCYALQRREVSGSLHERHMNLTFFVSQTSKRSRSIRLLARVTEVMKLK